MKTSRMLLAFALAAAPALAQHSHHGAPSSPYAGQQHREIKALSEKEVKDLLEGAGMGYAKPAELNRYPGPSHALELARELGLTPGQRERLEGLMKRHKAEARELGARVVSLERELDRLFATRSVDERSLERVLLEIAQAQARLRGSHLKAHLETTALLTPEQVQAYAKARGYGEAGAGQGGHRHH